MDSTHRKNLAKVRLQNAAIRMLIQRVPLDDAERIEIAECHPPWDGAKAWGSSQYCHYGENSDGRAVLYMSSRNVPANAPAPNVSTNPQNWKLVGSSKNPLT